MLNNYLIVLLFFSFIQSISTAQISQEEYENEVGSIEKKREALKSEIKTLKNEIDSLSKIIPELENQIATAFRELYELKYGKEIGWRVYNKRIWKGMTDEMVRDGWGKPDRIDKNVEAWGVFTQWIYGDIIFFFRDGKLIDWQEGPEH